MTDWVALGTGMAICALAAAVAGATVYSATRAPQCSPLAGEYLRTSDHRTGDCGPVKPSLLSFEGGPRGPGETGCQYLHREMSADGCRAEIVAQCDRQASTGERYTVRRASRYDIHERGARGTVELQLLRPDGSRLCASTYAVELTRP